MLAVNKDSFLRAQKNKRISAEDFPRTNIDTAGLKKITPKSPIFYCLHNATKWNFMVQKVEFVSSTLPPDFLFLPKIF